MKIITKFKKTVSLTVTASLLLSFVISPSTANVIINKEAANQYNELFDNFVLPYSYGQITKAHYAGTDRVVINIQDLHCHPNVQKNISNIIETFDKNYGINKIYLEGAYGKIDTSWINKKIQEYAIPDLLDKMLETGRLTGAEYYSALSGKNQIINGLEEKEPYLENVKRFADIVENREKINLILNAVEDSTKELKAKYYTKKQHNIDEISQQYKEGKINTQKYYGLLSKQTAKLGIDLSKYDNTLRYMMLMNLQKDLQTSKITKELHSLILTVKEKLPYESYKMLLNYTDNFTKVDKLFSFISAVPNLNIDLSSNYKTLDKYYRYIELSKKVNPVELVNEEVKLVQEINTRFSETKQQRDIVFLTGFERYLQNYLNSKITAQDYKYYTDNIAKYKELWNRYVDNRVLSLLDEYIKQADAFYKTNNERNIYFANKIFEDKEINKIKNETEAKEDINKIIDNINKVKKLDVVVTGGFHSQTVTDLLESKGISYIVITPKISQDTKFAQDTYYQLAKEQSEISFQAFAPAIASLSPELQNKIMNMALNPSQKEQETASLSEEDRAKLISELVAAKILESDDPGVISDKLQDIIKSVIGDFRKEKVTPETVSKIKNLQELLKDKEKLQKTIDLLGEDSVAKQSVMLVSDTFDSVYNLLDAFLKINANVNQETGVSKKTYFDEAKSKNEDVKKNINEFFSKANIDNNKTGILSKLGEIIGEEFEIKEEGFEVKRSNYSYYPSTAVTFTIVSKETKQTYTILMEVYTNLDTDIFSMEIKGNADRVKYVSLLDKLAREIMAGNLKKEADQSVEKIEKISKVYYDEGKSKSKAISENIKTFFAQPDAENKAVILSEVQEIISERAEIKKDSVTVKKQAHSFYPVNTITMTIIDKKTKQEYEISLIAFGNLGDMVFSIEINGDSKRTEFVGLTDKIALEIMNGRLNKSSKTEQEKSEQKDKVSKLYYDEGKSKSKAISENIESFFTQAYKKENEAVILSKFGELFGESLEIKQDSLGIKKYAHNSYPADIMTMTVTDKQTKQEYEISVVKFLNLDEINLIIEINGDSKRGNYVQFADKIATAIIAGKIIAKKVEQQPEKQIGNSNKSYYDESRKTDSSIRDNIDTFFARADLGDRERFLTKIEEIIGEVFEIEEDGVDVKIDNHPYYPTSMVKLPVIDRTTGQKYEISIVNFINLDLADFSINIKGDASREKYLPLLDKLAENIMSGSIETGKTLSLKKSSQSQLQKQSTQEILDKIGNSKIIQKLYEEKSGDKFKYTKLGVAIGVLLETFSFWGPNFVKKHNFDPSVQTKMTAVVWVIRALSIGLGVGVGVGSAIFLGPIALSAGIPVLILTETIAHFIWNIDKVPQITDLKESISPVNVEEEVEKTGLAQDFIGMVNRLSADKGFISVYEAYKQGRKKNTVRRKLTGAEHITKNNGYALGISTYYLGDGKVFEAVPAIADSETGMNLCTYNNGYYEFEQDGTRIRTNDQYLEKIFEDCIKNNKEIYFFLPPNIYSFDVQAMRRAQQEYMDRNPALKETVSGLDAYEPGITISEIEWIKSHPQYMKYVHFVVGSYTFLNENMRPKIFKRFFNINNNSKTVATLLSNPKAYMQTGYNLALQNGRKEFAEATTDYDENSRSVVLLVSKQDGTIYSVKVIRGYRLCLSSINDSICHIENSDVIERMVGVTINTNLNTRKIVAKSTEPGTTLSFVNADFNGIFEITSSLKGIPLTRTQQHLQEVEALVQDSDSQGKEYIYLDDSFQNNRDKINYAIQNNKLIVLYPFSNTYDIDSLTDKELFALYNTIRENIFIMAFSLFPSDISDLEKKEVMMIKYALQELVKNAFVHGNMADTSKPIYIKSNSEGIKVYNAVIEDSSIDKEIKTRRRGLASAAGLAGEHKGLQEIQSYEKEGLLEATQEIKTKTIDADGKTEEVKYYFATISLIDKQQPKKKLEVAYDSTGKKEQVITVLITKQDGTQYSVRFNVKKKNMYVSSVDNNAFSSSKSEYTTMEDIEKLTGVKIEISDNKIVATSEDSTTDLSFVKNSDISETVSSLASAPIQISKDQYLEFEAFRQNSNSYGIEYLFLDASPKQNKQIIERAVKDNKLLVLYPFSKTYDIDNLTDEELYSLYFDIQNKFFDLEETLFSDLPNLKEEDWRTMSYILKEYVKNAFVHGNLSDPSKPVYIKCMKDKFTVYNPINDNTDVDENIKAKRLNLSAAATLTGSHRALEIVQEYENEGLIETKQETKTQTVELNGKTKEIKYYSVTASKVDKEQQSAKTIEINYDGVAEKEDFVVILMTKPNGEKISIRFEPSFKNENGRIFPSRIYLNSINNDGYSKYDVNYNSADKIEKALGIKINIEPLTLTISNIPEDYDVTYVKKENVEKIVSGLKQFEFSIPSNEELEALQKTTQTTGTVFVYLDKDNEQNKKLITQAIEENRLIVVYPFSKTYDMDSLTDEELYSLYVSVCDRFKDMSKNLFPEFPTLYSHETMDIFLHEYVKNAFVHGNSSDPSKPIYIDCSKGKGGIVAVYNVVDESVSDSDKEKNKARRLALATAAWLTGMHVGLSLAGKMEFGLASQTVKEIDVKIGSKDRKLCVESLENLNYVAKMQKMEREQTKKAVSDTDIKPDELAKQKKSGEIIELPKQFARFADDYNQLANLDDLPSMDAFDYEKREAYQEFFEDDVFAVSSISQKVEFGGNTRYVYILQNQRNNEALFDVLKMQNVDVKFKLFALLYLDKMSRGFSDEEKEIFETQKAQVIEQFKNAVANNKFEILNNFDLRSYLTGIYLLIADFSEKENISYIANKAKFMMSRALIVRPDGKTLATSDGFFAQADFFTLVHELTHVMVPKPMLSNRVAFDTIDELVSYITPNLIMKLINFSVEAYKKISFKYYTLHYGKDSLDYVRMGSKFQALYNLFSDKTDDFVLEQDEHRSAIAFLDLLFYAHKNTGTQVSFDVLLKTITENMSNAKEVNQESMFYILLDKYFKNLVKENVLSEQDVQSLRKEAEKIQLWTLMSYDIINSIEQSSPEVFAAITDSKSPSNFYGMILATPNKTKDFFDINKVADKLKSKQNLTQKDIINLLIIEIVIGNTDYEKLAYDFDNVVTGIINVTSDALKLFDGKKQFYSLQEYEEIKSYFENNYSYITDVDKNAQIDISVIDNLIDFISSSIDKIFFINNLLNSVFSYDDKTLDIASKNLVITDSSQQAQTLNGLLVAENKTDIAVVSMEIINKPDETIRGGFMLDVNSGIRVKYDKENAKLIVYSKKGIIVNEEQIKEMIVQSYYDTRKETSLEGTIAFVDSSVTTMQAMENKIKNEYTNSIVMPNKETKFDISQRNITDINTVCKQEAIATGTKTFVISSAQAEQFKNAIEELRKEDFKFIVVYKSYMDFDTVLYDGVKIDGLLEDVAQTQPVSVSQVLLRLEKIKKEALKKGVDISLSVKVSDNVYAELEKQNINIFERYGILPIISADSKYVVSRNIGKTEVENITRENIEQILRNDNIASIVVDDATVICDKRAENKKIRTKEQKYNKGYKAALSSKFDYTVNDIKSMFDIIQTDFDSKTLKEQIDGLDLSLLSDDSRTYVEYLKSNEKYEEILGFIRGAVMNTVANEISSVTDMDKNAFLNDKKNKMVQAILITTIQKIMNGETIENIYKETAGSDELSAQEYLNSIRERINGDLDKVLRENEHKIVKVEPSAIADFNGIPELLSDIYGHKATVSNDVEVSLGAIKSILSAA